MDIIRTVYYIHVSELMKLIFAILDVLLTIGLTCFSKTEGFLYLLLESVAIANELQLEGHATVR